MDLQRQPIGAPKDLQIFERLDLCRIASIVLWYLIPDLLSSDTRSFGAWLEPRYIFGAGQLFDQ